MSTRFTPPLILVALLVASTAAAFYIAAQRHRVEASNRAVHLVADLLDIRLLAAGEGVPVGEALRRLEAAGLTGVAISEDTFDELLVSGRLVAVPGQPPRFATVDDALYERIAESVEERFGTPPSPPPAVILSPTREALPLPSRMSDLRPYGVGLDPATAGFISGLGLSPIARLANPPATDPDAIRHMLESASHAGAEGVIFQGDQVLGRRDLVPFVADEMRRLDLWFGFIEFTVQGGAARMLYELPDLTLRVHSMNPVEVDRTEFAEIVDRYVRAARERNIKVLFLRPVSLSGEHPLSSFEHVVSAISGRLEGRGFKGKAARPVEAPGRGGLLAVLLAVSVGALSLWLFTRFVRSPVLRVGFGAFLGLLVVGVYFGLWAKYVALLAALTFPIWAMLAAFGVRSESAPSTPPQVEGADTEGRQEQGRQEQGRQEQGRQEQGRQECLPYRGAPIRWVLVFFWVSAISVIGGLHVAGLLTELSFMIRLDQFMGVKLAHFLPPVVVGAYLLFEQHSFRGVMNQSVRWFDIALLGFVAVALLFMLMRTGNEAPGDVSSIEMRLRTILDRFLPERPRTKEFLVGHPALVLAVGMAALGDRRYLPLVGFLAAIGQASIVNTFAHLHTPISVSVTRVVVGLILGGLIGLAVFAVYRLMQREELRSDVPRS